MSNVAHGAVHQFCRPLRANENERRDDLHWPPFFCPILFIKVATGGDDDIRFVLRHWKYNGPSWNEKDSALAVVLPGGGELESESMDGR